jgi:hypothetical protein
MRNHNLLVLLVSSAIAISAIGCSPTENEEKGPYYSVKKEQTEFKNQGLHASLDWIKEPTEKEAGEFTLKFWKEGEGTSEGPYVTPSHDVAVTLWMPSMNHGSDPVQVSAKKDASGNEVLGEYTVSNLKFSMGGEWEIQVLLKNGEEVVEQNSFKFNY